LHSSVALHMYHSFPTRRSSDLTLDGCVDHRVGIVDEELHRHAAEILERADALIFGRVVYQMMEEAWRAPPPGSPWPDWMVDWMRSEEHTSELQSRRDLVCRLLL